MAEVFLIPTKKKETRDEGKDAWDHLIVADMPVMLQEHAQRVINKHKKEAVSSTSHYIQTLNSTYLLVMEEIKKSVGKELLVSFKNEKVSSGQPSVEKWGEDNPAKLFALNYIVAQLITCGWSPRLSISPYIYERESDCYSGGDSVVLACLLID